MKEEKNNGVEFFFKEKYPEYFKKGIYKLDDLNGIKESTIYAVYNVSNAGNRIYDFTGNIRELSNAVANVRFLEPISITILNTETTDTDSTNNNSNTLEEDPFERLYRQILNNNG